MFKEAILQLTDRRDLAEADAISIMDTIMEGKATQAQIGAFLTALRMKGESPAEIAAFAKVMRRDAVAVRPERKEYWSIPAVPVAMGRIPSIFPPPRCSLPPPPVHESPSMAGVRFPVSRAVPTYWRRSAPIST